MLEICDKFGAGSVGKFVFVKSDTGVGVVIFDIVIIFNEGEDSFNVIYGEARDTGKIAGVGIINWIFCAVAIFGGTDWILDGSDGGSFIIVGGCFLFKSPHLFKNTHVFDVALVIFDFCVPGGICG